LVDVVALSCLPGVALAAPETAAVEAPVAPVDAAAASPPPAPDTSRPAKPTAAEPATSEEEAPPPRRKHRRAKRRSQEDEEAADSNADNDDANDASSREADHGSQRQRDWHASATRFIIGAERLTGFARWSRSETVPNAVAGQDATGKVSGTEIFVLSRGRQQAGNYYGIPRLGFDGRFAGGFTLGASFSYLAGDTKNESKLGSSEVTSEGPTETIFLAAARLGYLFEVSPLLSLWPRAGMSRLSVAHDSVQESSTTTLVSVDLDPQLVFTPIPHVGFCLGLNLDIGVAGTRENTDVAPSRSSSETNLLDAAGSHDTSASSYGASAGLIALF
jgi:hypothetical protein